MDNFNIQKFFKSQYLQEDKMSSDREIEIIKKMNPDADEKSLKKIAKLGKGKVSEGVEKEMFTYLDELRDTGVTNMFGAAPYLQREFDLEKREAREILAKWMQSQMNEVELTPDFGELDEAEIDKREKAQVKKIVKQLKKSVKSHDKQAKTLDKLTKESLDELAIPGPQQVEDQLADLARAISREEFAMKVIYDLPYKVKKDVLLSMQKLFTQREDVNEALDFEDVMYLRDEQKDLEDRIAQLYRDMEQEAEPEGGEIADYYGNQLDRLEDKLYGVRKQVNDYDMNENVKALKEKLEQVNEKLCKKGEAYRKRRMAAGEKSSAYLSGRAVKVCKGQMSGKKKKK